jgi:hypothetical protein
MQSEEGNHSNVIVLSFLLATDYGDPLYPGPTQSPQIWAPTDRDGSPTDTDTPAGGSSLLAPLLGVGGVVVVIGVVAVVVVFGGGGARVGAVVVVGS